MKTPFELSEELKSLHITLKKKEKNYKRIKWIFKPFIVVAVILLLLTAVLPILAPIVWPILAIGAAAFIVRFLLYKYAFGDPKTKLQQAFDNAIKEMLANYGDLNFYNERIYNNEDFDQIKIGIKKADGVSQRLHFKGTWNNLNCTAGYLSAMHESISFSGILQDAASGIIDDIMGLDGDIGGGNETYSGDRKNIFRGWVTQIESELINNEWVIAPIALGKLLINKSKFVGGWQRTTALEGQYMFITKSGETCPIALKMLQIINDNNLKTVFISAVKGKLFVVFRWKSEYTYIDINNEKTFSESLFTAFYRQFESTNACVKALEA